MKINLCQMLRTLNGVLSTVKYQHNAQCTILIEDALIFRKFVYKI